MIDYNIIMLIISTIMFIIEIGVAILLFWYGWNLKKKDNIIEKNENLISRVSKLEGITDDYKNNIHRLNELYEKSIKTGNIIDILKDNIDDIHETIKNNRNKIDHLNDLYHQLNNKIGLMKTDFSKIEINTDKNIIQMKEYFEELLSKYNSSLHTEINNAEVNITQINGTLNTHKSAINQNYKNLGILIQHGHYHPSGMVGDPIPEFQKTLTRK